MTGRPCVIAVSGASGVGKTRLLARLIPALGRRGVSVAVLKHTRHEHPFDRPGKDTEVLRRAGAVAAAIEGPSSMAFFGPPAGGLRALLRLLPPVDLVLAEGFKGEPVPRVEVHRRAISRAFLCARDPRVFAIVTDEPPPRPVRVFSDAEIGPLADLLCARAGRARKPRGQERLRVTPVVSSLRGEESGRKVAPGRRERMAKTTTTKRKSGATRGARRSGTSRSGAGRKGGKATLRTRGREFYSEIGRKGAKSRRASRTSGGSKTSSRTTSRGTSRKSGAARGGRTSRSSSRTSRSSR